MKQLYLIRRSFHTDLTRAKKISQLQYCSQLWRPKLVNDLLFIEQVQRLATKYILSDYRLDYKCRLQQLYLLQISDVLFFVRSVQSLKPHCKNWDVIITQAQCD